jgi:hypothetical protein
MNEILKHAVNIVDSMKNDLENLIKVNQVNYKISFNLNMFTEEHFVNNMPQINTKNKVIYMFHIEGDLNIQSFLEFRKENKHSIKLPKINKTNTNSKVLYVGSVNENFKTRIQQHLGFGSDKTYSLQLKKWVSNNILFTLDYYILEEINELTLRLLERNFASSMQPILGRHIIY